MSTSEQERRVLAPGDPVSDAWMTMTDCKRVLAIMPHLQAGTRLAFDVLPHLETSPDVQIVWSTPDDAYRWDGFDEFVRGQRGLVVPWRQAVEGRHDLVVAACSWGVADTKGSKLLMAHGAGAARSRIGPFPGRVAHDLTPDTLMRDDEVVPTALVLAHDGELAVLEDDFPRALASAVVAGDPCFDRMLASGHLREDYRDALGVRPGQKLVVVTTTWSKHSLFGNDKRIFAKLMAALPREEYRVVAVLHPFVWHGHSHRQVLAWLADARAAGMVVLPPEEGWRAALVAADLVIGDHGSLPQYAAALGVPVLLNAGSLLDVRPGSTVSVLAERSTPLHPDLPLLPQVRQAMDVRPPADFAALISSRPGQAAAIIRRTCFDLLGLPEPSRPVVVEALSLPVPIEEP